MTSEVIEARTGFLRRLFAGKTGPVLVVVGVLIVIWYAGAVAMNAPRQRDLFKSQNITWSTADMIRATLAQKRPVLPAPHQVLVEMNKTILQKPVSSKRSLVFHAYVTLSSTLLGFVFGVVFGVLLAIGIVHVRSLDRSLMPWIIASQTIPILAIAPMVVVVLGAVGLKGLVPKAIISAYLCFFPVAIGMVKGLRSPDPMQMDLMRTYNAGGWQTLWKLRWPASVPFLFTSLKVAIAASLVGAIVGELPTGAQGGLGARLLAGSYYGQTVQIWSALVTAAILAASAVAVVGLAERFTLARMGQRL